jgi:phenylalanyl-tRNA synthetase beta chain
MLRLKNPQSSNQSAMRTSLVPQLLQNLVYNLNHGEKNIKLFELGKTYHKAEGLSYNPITWPLHSVEESKMSIGKTKQP